MSKMVPTGAQGSERKGVRRLERPVLMFLRSFITLFALESVAQRHLFPIVGPMLETAIARFGAFSAYLALSIFGMFFFFFGLCFLLLLPAMLGVKHGRIQPEATFSMDKLKCSMPLIVLNALWGALIVAVAMMRLDVSLEKLPGFSKLAFDCLVFLALEEMIFFFVHRAFHRPDMYRRFHKIHHSWTAPVGFISIYCHPLEHLLANVGPLLVGPLLMHTHVLVLILLINLGLIHTAVVHSGYWVCDDDGLHDYHHEKFNFNFGVFGIFDTICGTLRFQEKQKYHA